MFLVVLCGVLTVAMAVWLVLARQPKSPQSRRSARVQIVLPVELETFGSMFQAASQNISGGGMLLKSEAPVKVAQPLTLSFTLPGETAIEIPAVVCHKRGPLFGVQFDPTFRGRTVIEKWVLRAIEEDHRRAAKAAVAAQEVSLK